MDSVRSAHFMPNGEVLATVSEDCMVKLWSLESIESKYSKLNGNVEPFLTLRGHTGPLLAVAGLGDSKRKNSQLLFTAGDEGCIRVWDVPSISEVNQYGDTFDGKNYCVGVWSDESNREAIWDLKYHPFQDLLLSISASSSYNSVLVWNCNDVKA